MNEQANERTNGRTDGLAWRSHKSDNNELHLCKIKSSHVTL